MDLAATRTQYLDAPARAAHLPPHTILVVVDPTAHAQPALEKAVRIASRCGSQLELYICDVEQQIPESWAGGARFDQYRKLRRQQLLDDLEALAQPLRDRGLAVGVVCEWHAPLEQGIGFHAIRSRPDLVVKETHWHARMRTGTQGQTDWNLARQVPMPLLLVRARPWPEQLRFAAAVDPCHPADRPATLDAAILRDSRSLARALGGALDVYHVLQMPPHLPGEYVPLEEIAALHANTRTVVAQLAQTAEVVPQFTEGLVAEGLARLANQHHPDVLVMGAVARARSAPAPAGGTASLVLEQVHCDLLVVKPPGFVSPLLVTAE